MKRVASFLVGFVSGAAAGSLMGVLFTPRDGRDIRDRISFQISRIQARLKDLTEKKQFFENDAKSEGRELVDNVEKEAQMLQDQLKEIFEEIENTKHKS